MAASSTPSVVKVTTVMSSVAAASFEGPLSSEGGEAVAVRVPAPPGVAPADSAALSGDMESAGQLSGSDAWQAAEHCPSVSALLLLLLLLGRSSSCVFSLVFSLAGGAFRVQESWSNSGSGWTLMAEPGLSLLGSLATWWPEDCRPTSPLTADCQLLEQRTAGMLQGQ